MLGAQSVPRFTDTSAETTAPPAAIAASTIDWSKRHHSSIRRISSSLTLAILDRLTFSCVRPTFQNPDAIIVWVHIFGEFGDHSVGETKSGTFRSRKATVSRA